jgi:hypothetical protein
MQFKQDISDKVIDEVIGQYPENLVKVIKGLIKMSPDHRSTIKILFGNTNQLKTKVRRSILSVLQSVLRHNSYNFFHFWCKEYCYHL